MFNILAKGLSYICVISSDSNLIAQEVFKLQWVNLNLCFDLLRENFLYRVLDSDSNTDRKIEIYCPEFTLQ